MAIAMIKTRIGRTTFGFQGTRWKKEVLRNKRSARVDSIRSLDRIQDRCSNHDGRAQDLAPLGIAEQHGLHEQGRRAG